MLTLGGSNTADNTFAGDLADNGSGALSVAKTGAGKWVLSGTNTYSGTTVLDGGTLAFGSADRALGTLTLAGDTTVELGPADISFTDSSAIAWRGELTLTGTLGATTLRFGTSSSGLTSGQLAHMNMDGQPVRLDGDGYAVVSSGPGTLVVIH